MAGTTGGCSPLASSGAAHDAALGTITISTPQFKPILPRDAVSEIDFGKFKEVQSLWESLSAANLSSSSMSVAQTNLAAKLQLAGPTIDSSQVTTLAADGTASTTGATTTALKTPAVPTPPAAPGLPPDTVKALNAILVANELKPKLTPDQIATLVAAYRSYMTNIEQFNRPPTPVDGSGWYPYRVNFLVSVDPGWYAIQNDYEALVRVKFGDDMQVINVMPAEAAQIIEDFNANLQGLALGLELSGAAGLVGAGGKVERITESAHRLEGLRTNTSMVVSFPSGNEVGIRFRPSLTADEGNLRDLQPTTRLMTAIVLVKNPNPSAAPQANAHAVPGGRQADQMNEHGKATQTLALELPAMARTPLSIRGQTVAVDPLPAFDASIKYEAQYIPSLVDKSKTFQWFRTSFRSAQVHEVRNIHATPLTATVPAYRAEAGQPLKIKTLDGSPQQSGDHWVVNVAYELDSPYPTTALSVQVAGATPNSIDVANGPFEQGTLQLTLPSAPEKGRALKLPVRFIATCTNGSLTDVKLTAIGMLTIGSDAKPADAGPKITVTSPGVEAKDLPINDVTLQLLQTLIGQRSEVRLTAAPPVTPPAVKKD